MKKTLLVMLAVVVFAPLAQADTMGASDPNVGCGWGSSIWSGKKDKKLFALFAGTTNGTFTQTFGISSETAGCNVKGGWVRNDKKAAAYAEVNLQKLSTEMAQGGGEYLEAFATLMGAADEASKKEFMKMAQDKYAVLFPSPKTDSASMMRSLRKEMLADPKLATL